MSEEIDRLREVVDTQDEIILNALGPRFEATRRIGEIKAQSGTQARDLEREDHQMARAAEIAVEKRYSIETAQKVLSLIIGEVLVEHSELREQFLASLALDQEPSTPEL